MNRFVVDVKKGASPTLTTVLQRGRGRVVSVSGIAQEENAYGTHSNKTDGRDSNRLRQFWM